MLLIGTMHITIYHKRKTCISSLAYNLNFSANVHRREMTEKSKSWKTLAAYFKRTVSHLPAHPIYTNFI